MKRDVESLDQQALQHQKELAHGGFGRRFC